MHFIRSPLISKSLKKHDDFTVGCNIFSPKKLVNYLGKHDVTQAVFFFFLSSNRELEKKETAGGYFLIAREEGRSLFYKGR